MHCRFRHPLFKTYPRPHRSETSDTLIVVMSSERARAITATGKRERDSGALHAALKCYREAEALYRLEGTSERLAHTIRHIADMDREAGNIATSEQAYRESLALYRELPDVRGLDLANALNGFATLLAQKGDAAEAVLLTCEARELYSAEGVVPGVEECTERLARLSDE